MRTALITGASRGLGRALAAALAERGYRLILTARNAADLDATREALKHLSEVAAIAGDVADPRHRARLADVVRDLGGLDLLINNAGVLGPSPRPMLLDLPPEELERICRVNAVAPIAMVQALRDLLPAGACIVNLSSDAAPECFEGWGGYGASKAMLDHLSGTLALENPQWRVYWIDPGDMRTRLYEESFPGDNLDYLHPPEVSVPRFLELIQGNEPSGRYFAQDRDALYPSF
jgi:NAD(P)-dependent dehydrogenase (short-subunit alcohol dehydrogenase family)